MELIEGHEAPAIARRRARYSRYDWVAWQGRDGVRRASRISAESVKLAMLASGTQGCFTVYEKRSGIAMVIHWKVASIFYRKLVRGTYY